MFTKKKIFLVLMDNKILKLDYNKIKELIDFAQKEDLKIIEKKNKKLILKNKKKIIKSIKKTKKIKINNSKKKLKGGMTSKDIIKINDSLINDLRKLEDIEDSLSTISEDAMNKFPLNYCDYDFSSESSEEEFIETFTN